jgi:hypothetical protein
VSDEAATSTLPDSPTGNFSDQLNAVLKSAPELGTSPGLSVGLASAGGDVSGNAQATARGTNAISDQNAHDRVAGAVGGGGELTSALNWFGNHVVAAASSVGSDAVKGAEDVGSKVLGTLNKPLQIVQHEYRYLHDVEARHGLGAAVLEGIGIAGGAAAGLVAGGGYGAVLGSEAAAGVEGQLFYKDSWDRTTDGKTYVDPNTHQPVSFGRDVVSELGHVDPMFDRGTTAFKLASGVVDAIGDLNVGGTEVGGLISQTHSAEGASGLLGDYFGGTGATTAEDVDRAYSQYGSVRRAFSDIADKTAGEIALTPAYRSLAQQSNLLTALGEAHTGEEVAQVFKEVVRANELSFSNKLPTLAITRLPFQKASEAFQNSAIAPAQRFSKMTSRLPDAWDDVAQAFSGHQFDPTSTDDGTVGIARMARFTEDRRTAAMIATEYANAPDLMTKVRIYRNLSLSTLFNLAGFREVTEDEFLAEYADPAIQQKMGEALDKIIGGGMFGRGATYGLDDEGRNLSIVRDPQSGWEYGAGITQNQTGKLAFLDLNQARRAAKFLKADRDLFGRVGDFAFDHITQGIFKPLVLLTPSYALHISLAELIPNALRLGVGNLVKSGLEINSAKLGSTIDDGDAEDLAGEAYRMAKGNQADIPLVARYIEYNRAKVPEGLSSGHAYEAEVANREEKTTSMLRNNYFDSPQKRSVLGKTFGAFGVGSEQHTPAWQAWLREISNDPASRIGAQGLIDGARSGLDLDAASGRAADQVADFLRNMPEDERGRMIRGISEMTGFKDIPRPAGMDNFDEWARTIVANIRGATRGADRTMHVPLLSHIANGEWASEDELNDIPETQRPILVKGRELLPDGSSPVQRLANIGFKRVLNPMVDFLSRQPIAWAEFKGQYAIVEKAVQAGTMDEDEAMTLAMTRTVNNVIKNVHNLTDRTQWTVTLRNWAPFYFAQEQAYRRMGRLLAEDPGAFRKYQLMISNIHDVGQVFSGKNGQGYLVLPGTGFMTAGVAQAASMIGLPVEGSSPIGMGWNLSASSVIFPLSAGFRPDIGPLLAVPVQAISQLFPETVSPVLKADLTSTASTVLGPIATEPIYEQMIPNTIVQRLLSAVFPQFNARSFNGTMMQVLATLEAQGKVPPPGASAWKMQAFLDSVRNQTRIMYAMKAIVGAVTPVSPELTDQVYNKANSELSADINSEKSVSKGIQKFLEKNPDASPYTVFQSSNQQGVSIPSSVQAENWIESNLPLIRQYPSAALLLLPPNTNTKYNSSVYNEQIAQGLRTKWFPGDVSPNGELEGYLAQLYVSAGNALVLDKWYPQYEKQLQGLSGTAKYDAEQNWQTTLASYAKQNPVWGTWWNADDREIQRGQVIIQMKALLNSPEAPKTAVASDTRLLLSAYDHYQNQLTVGSQDGFAGQSQSAIDQQWKDNLYATAAAHPDLVNVISGLFLSIPSTGVQQVNMPKGTPGAFSTTKWNAAA